MYKPGDILIALVNYESLIVKGVRIYKDHEYICVDCRKDGSTWIVRIADGTRFYWKADKFKKRDEAANEVSHDLALKFLENDNQKEDDRVLTPLVPDKNL